MTNSVDPDETAMIGSSPKCYIPSFMTIGLLVREKIF